METFLFCLLVCFDSTFLFNNYGHIATVADCTKVPNGRIFTVLPHWKATSSAQDMTSHTRNGHIKQVQGRPLVFWCFPFMLNSKRDATTTCFKPQV